VLARGEVPGVGFRSPAGVQARHLGLTGFARNLPDGTVELEIEGREESVAHMLRWLHNGPRHATVTALEVTDLETTGEHEFEITG
jgi:acylphosphatase